MPQMAPMNWMLLYIMFSMVFLIFNFFNYYMFMIKNKIKELNFNYKNKSMNWKW